MHTNLFGHLESVYMNSADPVYYKELRLRAKNNRNNPTEAESYLWEMLRDKKMEGYKFRRQHILGKYIVDFICLSKSLIIEVDGGYHDTPDQQYDDAVRSAFLEKLGYTVIRFKNEEIVANTDDVLQEIKTSLLK